MFLYVLTLRSLVSYRYILRKVHTKKESNTMKILIVDDDKDIVELLSIYVKNEGYEVERAYNGKEAITKLNTNPVLMLSAKTDDLDKIQGLIQGADDYVTKPFNPLEVMARVKSLLRRSQHDVKNDEPDQIEIGPLIIKKDSHEVETVTGKSIQLTALEFGILYLLASHPNRVFSADEIFERVWQQESVVSAKTVMVHVSHLRDKIEESTGGEKVIQTVWGVGYKIESH